MITKLLPDVVSYLNGSGKRDREKMEDMIRLLEERNGYLEEPYSRHLGSKIRELRVSLGKSEHRILYTLMQNEAVHLTAFPKKSKKADKGYIDRAIKLRKAYLDVKNRLNLNLNTKKDKNDKNHKKQNSKNRN